ncbi:MAG TPA: endonuclease Q family protein [Elusimicrobiota bacterium]|nr:endonuclease Q family protein [Elusimicrobiota bacterium]
MKYFADFHIHSKYSPNTHPDMELPTLVKWAKIKGISLLGSGDFTNPQWSVELQKFLKPASGRGVYEYEDVRFVLTAEVNNVFSKNGKTYRIHHLIFAPNFMLAAKICDILSKYGDLDTDARPHLSLNAEEMVRLVKDVSPDCLVVPSHPWSPNYSAFSPGLGFDRIEECYGSQSENVRVWETGLGCDPSLARRWPQMKDRTFISNSDAMTPFQLGREANLFDCPLDYRDIITALVSNDSQKFIGTVEMLSAADRNYSPGHKDCKMRSPDGKSGGSCSVCGKPFSPAVSDRFQSLRPVEGGRPIYGVMPLVEILAGMMGFQPEAETVQRQYMSLTANGNSELDMLVLWPEERLRKDLPSLLAENILALRRGDVDVEPGYDGVPGRFKIRLPEGLPKGPEQLKLF